MNSYIKTRKYNNSLYPCQPFPKPAGLIAKRDHLGLQLLPWGKERVECISNVPGFSMHCPREKGGWLTMASMALQDCEKEHNPETSPSEGERGMGHVHP